VRSDRLGGATLYQLGPAFYESYVRFVNLVNEAALGGGRFAGEKLKQYLFQPADVRVGSKADKPSRAKNQRCPLLLQ
jgi:hypothetical protein